MDRARSVLRHAARFGSGTFLSRCAGLTRDILMAAILGSGESVAAFFMAFRFSNVLRRILGEGSMQAALVPVFEEIRAKDEKEAASFFRSTWLAVTAALVMTIFVGEICMAISLFFVENPQNLEILKLCMIMAPGLLFICWYGIQAALCTCYGHFFIPAAAPAAFNILWICTLAVMHRESPAEIVVVLSAIVVFAYAAQWGAVAPLTHRALSLSLGKAWWKGPLGSFEPLKRLVAPLTLGLLGVSATQLNSAIDAIFARIADPSGPAYLWYAVRMEQVPVALVGVSLSSAVLPELARCLQLKMPSEFARLVRTTLIRSGQIVMGTSFFFFGMGYSLMELVFCRGAFCRGATAETALCLWAYALGLLPQVWTMLFIPAFYAAKDYRTPSLAAAITLVVNVSFNAFLVYGLHLGSVSIALGTGIASIVNLYILMTRIPGTLSKEVWTPIVKLLPSLIVALLASLAVGVWMGDPTLEIMRNVLPTGSSEAFPFKALRLGCQLAAFGAGFLLMGGLRVWRATLRLASPALVG